MKQDTRRFVLVATVKDEGPSIVEWVAHHLNIGFTDIIIYQNNSTDGTQKLLRTMARQGFITYFPNDNKRGQWQNRAYRRASFLDTYKDADWVMALDGDGFLLVKVGDGKVADLVDAVPDDVNAIQVNWKLFGSSNRKSTSDALVTEDFVWCEKSDRIALHLIGFKSLFRPSDYVRPGIHRPKVLREGKVDKICNGSGLKEGFFDAKGWRSADTEMRKLAQVNHYVIRDAQRFMIKSARGRTSNEDREVATEYWREYDLTGELDADLAIQANATRARMKAMDEACNGRLTFLTGHARRIQKERFDELMKEQLNREVFSSITGDTLPDVAEAETNTGEVA
jgi:glycosyl transferase family 2